MEWLGYRFDSNQMLITIPEAKMCETHQEACAWMTRTAATKQQLQFLDRKLNYISNCVRPARRFMNRLPLALRKAHDKNSVDMDEELRRDMAWFRDFAEQFNGKLLIEPKLPCLVLECDACPRGGGGFSDTNFYSRFFTDHPRVIPYLPVGGPECRHCY